MSSRKTTTGRSTIAQGHRQTKGKGKGGKARPTGVGAAPPEFILQPARPEDPDRARQEIAFLETIGAASRETAAEQVIDILSPAASGSEVDVLQACFQAIRRFVNQAPNGLVAFLQSSGIECLRTVKTVVEQKPIQDEIKSVLGMIGQKASAYIECVDHVDFQELPQVLTLFTRLSKASDLVCRTGLQTLSRFASYDNQHRSEILENGIMSVLSSLMTDKPQPELLRQTFNFLMRLCAPPTGREAAAYILAEPDLLPNIMYVLEKCPLDQGLQLAGFRLLALWTRTELDLRKQVLESGAPAALQKVRSTLNAAGLSHIASWLWCIAGRSLVEEAEAAAAWLEIKEQPVQGSKPKGKDGGTRKSKAGGGRESRAAR